MWAVPLYRCSVCGQPDDDGYPSWVSPSPQIRGFCSTPMRFIDWILLSFIWGAAIGSIDVKVNGEYKDGSHYDAGTPGLDFEVFPKIPPTVLSVLRSLWAKRLVASEPRVLGEVRLVSRLTFPGEAVIRTKSGIGPHAISAVGICCCTVCDTKSFRSAGGSRADGEFGQAVHQLTGAHPIRHVQRQIGHDRNGWGS